MLPDVATQDGDAKGSLHAIHQGVVLVRRRGDDQLAVFVYNEPDPAGSEASAGRTRRLELGLKVLHGPESPVDGVRQLRGRGAAGARRSHLLPKEVVVVGATTTVAIRRAGLDGCLLELEQRRLRLALQGLVDVRHVGVVVLVVVELHGGFVDGRLQGIVSIRQGHQVVRFRLLHNACGTQQGANATGEHVTARGRRAGARGDKALIEASGGHEGGSAQRHEAARTTSHLAHLLGRRSSCNFWGASPVHNPSALSQS
mmetsp:Transcript_128179/g.409814  ORF Transcript_128179/g.409814 Transcript_128179/m.409814 type:complete len:257 (-) Transcript_128179:43-813(-)